MAALGLARATERELRVFSRLWRGSLFSNFLAPILMLGALGLGVGDLVQAERSLGGVDYLAFVAPGLLVASAMQGGAGEALWGVMAGHKWLGHHRAMVSTPMTPTDVFGGFLTWTAIRTTVAATVFLAVAWLLGGVSSAWGVLAVPAAVLGALAFAAPLAAWSAGRDSDASFGVIMRLGIMPVFLFSGTVFPVQELPDALETAAVLSPLYHAAEIARGATTGSLGLVDAAGHAAVLGAVVAAGAAWGVRAFHRRLVE